MSDERPTDMTGAELRPGRFIAYAGLSGRSADLRLGMVRSLDTGGGRLGIYTQRGTKASLTYTKRCVALDDDRVPDGRVKDLLMAKRDMPLGRVVPGTSIDDDP